MDRGVDAPLQRSRFAPGSRGGVVAGRDDDQVSEHGLVLSWAALQKELKVAAFVCGVDTHGGQERTNEIVRGELERVDQGFGRVVFYLPRSNSALRIAVGGAPVVEEDVPVLR